MYELTLPEMTGEPCRQTITGAVLADDGNASLTFEMTVHKVLVTSVATLVELSDAIEATGYHIEQAAPQPEQGHHHCDLCD